MRKTEPKDKSLKSLSAKAISKAVIAEGFSANSTKFPLAVGGLGFLACLLFGPSLPLVLAAIGGGLVGGGSLFYNCLIKGDDLKLEYIRQIQAKIREESEKRRKEIEKLLHDCQDISGADSFIEQAIAQYEHIQESLEGFLKVLEMKLDKGELTFSTFVGPGELVANSVLDNLEEIVVTLESIRSIDVGYIKTRLSKLSRTKEKTPEDLAEEQAFKERQNIYEKQIQRVRALLVQNEEGITVLETSTTKIGQMNTQERFSELSLKESLAELQKIAERSQLYNKGGKT